MNLILKPNIYKKKAFISRIAIKANICRRNSVWSDNIYYSLILRHVKNYSRKYNIGLFITISGISHQFLPQINFKFQQNTPNQYIMITFQTSGQFTYGNGIFHNSPPRAKRYFLHIANFSFCKRPRMCVCAFTSPSPSPSCLLRWCPFVKFVYYWVGGELLFQ